MFSSSGEADSARDSLDDGGYSSSVAVQSPNSVAVPVKLPPPAVMKSKLNPVDQVVHDILRSSPGDVKPPAVSVPALLKSLP